MNNATTKKQESGKLVGKIFVKPGKEKIILSGAPIIFSGAVARISGPVRRGGAVLVCSLAGEPLAWGMYNDASEVFRVRVLQVASEWVATPELVLNLPELLKCRISQACELRQSLGLPSAATTAYRLINSEGDRLSGLTVDVFGSHLVAQSSALWVEEQRDAIIAILRSVSGISSVYWRPQGDILSKNEGWSGPLEPCESYYEGDDEAQVFEEGVRYTVSVRSGQKTGFYADQRDNRRFVGAIAKGKRVLDLCCYSGGFALHAALAGAAEVTAVDSSQSALDLAARNAQSNNVAERIRFAKADVANFMAEARTRGETWDLIILDPPKLAPSRKSLGRASTKYRKLNEQAFGLLKSGGILMSCSCSGAMTQSGGFIPLLHETARFAKRPMTVLRHAGTGADHPIDAAYPEGAYLSNVTLRML